MMSAIVECPLLAGVELLDHHVGDAPCVGGVGLAFAASDVQRQIVGDVVDYLTRTLSCSWSLRELWAGRAGLRGRLLLNCTPTAFCAALAIRAQPQGAGVSTPELGANLISIIIVAPGNPALNFTEGVTHPLQFAGNPVKGALGGAGDAIPQAAEPIR